MKQLLLHFFALSLLTACNDQGTIVADKADSTKSDSTQIAHSTMDTAKAKQELSALADEIHGLLKKKDQRFVDAHMSKDGIYMGTDPDEVWSYDTFRNYIQRAFSDSAMKISDYTISKREIRVHGNSALIIDQFMLPEISTKAMVRTISHANHENGKWTIDMYSWNLIPKNTDLQKINKAL